MKLSHARGHRKKLVNILKLSFHEELSDFIWAVAFKSLSHSLCEQQRCRSDCNKGDLGYNPGESYLFTNGMTGFDIVTQTNVNSPLHLLKNPDYTRFIQKVPGLDGYLNKLTSFHPDISYTHFPSQFYFI